MPLPGAGRRCTARDGVPSGLRAWALGKFGLLRAYFGQQSGYTGKGSKYSPWARGPEQCTPHHSGPFLFCAPLPWTQVQTGNLKHPRKRGGRAKATPYICGAFGPSSRAHRSAPYACSPKPPGPEGGRYILEVEVLSTTMEPAFMTQVTWFMATSMSESGSPSTATRSA
jgi:hypothetical protein